ncbi:MAG TPA: S9 family peptidase [Holophagaceae bacterium]|nr:S9 family peptidase [Holophagaceae bacterium]
MRLAYLLAATSLTLAAQSPFQIDDMFKVHRVADATVSSKGDIAWQVGNVDLAANKVVNHLWIRWANKNNGITGNGMILDTGEGSASHARFSPDGAKVAYSQGGQLWVLDLESNTRKQITHHSAGASGHAWSPDGKWIAFLGTTVPSGVDAENAAYQKAKEASKVKAALIKNLMFRHWNEWRDPMQVGHLFVVKADGSATPIDVTAGWKHDVPDFGDTGAGDPFSWAGNDTLVFGSHEEAAKGDSTNGDLYEVKVSAPGQIRNLTAANRAMDNTPRVSPDGKYLAYRAQQRPGFESDRFELRVMERATGKIIATTDKTDLSFEDLQWQGGDILAAAVEKGRHPLYRWTPGKAPVNVTPGGHLSSFAVAGSTVIGVEARYAKPPEVVRVHTTDGKIETLTRLNAGFVANLSKTEEFWFEGALGQQVHAFTFKPANFDPAKKYPVAFLIHGGPQSPWTDGWSYRWNPQVWAGRGYHVVMINFHGSGSYGQAFCDQISGDWSGAVMTDLMKGLDAYLKANPSADAAKVIAAGGSYGGYSTNWLAGHQPDRFAAFVTHAGIYNLESMQVGTEEMWFPKWEFKGWPWESAETLALWRKHSPHLSAQNFKKPMLVVHGELDFRVPYSEGVQLFNTLQLRGIPSEFLSYPDEGHWILKPQNSKLWHETVLGWADRWAK